MTTYQPLPGDLEEYRAYCEAIESGAIHPAEASRFSFGSFARIAAIASTGNID